MITRSTLLIGMALILVSSCSVNKQKNNETSTETENNSMTSLDTTTTASGLKIAFKERGNGAQAAAGTVVKVHYVGKLLNGTEFDNSLKRGEPIQFPLGQGYVIKGWDEGIALMKVGDKATLVIPSELGYGAQDMGNIPPNSTLVFDVELIEVKEMREPKPFDVEGKKIEKNPSGLMYVRVHDNPDGEQAYANMTAEVEYTLYLEDGTMVDSSIPRGTPFSFVLGAGQVIPGWDEGIRLMKVGDKMRLIVPSKLGYGERGAGGVIPPNATLIFDVELLSVRR